MDKFLITAKETAPLLVLMVFYITLAFFNLGNRESPQTAWTGSDSVIFDFGEARHFSRFQFMAGARHDVDFMLFASEDGNDWHFSLHVQGFDVFAWSERQMDTVAKYVQIVPFGPGLRLQEAAFRDQHDNLMTPVHLFTPESYVLFDEQELVPLSRSFMNSFYFDEIFHARTGYELLHGLPVYETTHPPMGKNFIALSVSVFGMTPFGWRFPGTAAGILMIPLIYIFGRMIFRSAFWGMFAAFIFTFDFMPFVQTRIATIDSYITLFVIASYLCMYAYIKNNETLWKALLLLFGCGLFIGLAIASKWQGVYAAIGLPFVFFPVLLSVYQRNKREAWITFGSCFAFFIAIPVMIYLLSYIPFVRASAADTGFLSTVIANQQHMFSYHAELLEGHTFSSRWWEWLLITRPIFYYSNTISPDVRQGISAFGNPAVWWMGIFAAIYAVSALFDKKQSEDQTIVFLLIAYAAQFLPWVFVYRATFIYHYFPSVPFVVLLITFFFKNYVSPKYPRAVWGYGAVVLGLFILFFPVLSGAPVSVHFVQTFLRWFPAWVLV